MKFIAAIGAMIMSAYLAIHATHKNNMRSSEVAPKKNKTRMGTEGKKKTSKKAKKSRSEEESFGNKSRNEMEGNKSRYSMEN